MSKVNLVYIVTPNFKKWDSVKAMGGSTEMFSHIFSTREKAEAYLEYRYTIKPRRCRLECCAYVIHEAEVDKEQ